MQTLRSGPEAKVDREIPFINEDGSPATWLETTAAGDKVRRYSVADIAYTKMQRLKRAWKWWATGFVGLVLVWGLQISAGTFVNDWWYAWTVLPLFTVGLGLYLLKGEATLTPGAVKAKAYIATQERQREEARKAAAAARLAAAVQLVFGVVLIPVVLAGPLWAAALVVVQCITWLKAGVWQPVPAFALFLSSEAQVLNLRLIGGSLSALDLVPSWGSFDSLDSVVLAVSGRMVGFGRIVAWLLELPLLVWLLAVAFVSASVGRAR